MYYKRLLAAILFLKYVCAVIAFPERTDLNSPSLSGVLTALRRTGNEPATYSRELDCRIDMAGIPGEYFYTSHGSEDICVIYFLAREDHVVEIEFKVTNYECDENTHVQWFDGWSMGTGSFPSEEDHPLNMTERIQDVCPGEGRPLIFRANQNVAMMTFKLIPRGSSLRIVLRPKQILEPCNVMAQNPSGIYTIRNYGAARNCSFSSIYATRVNVVEMAIGQERSETMLKCTEGEDHVQFLAGNDLDSSYMRQDAVICGAVGHVISPVRSTGRSGADIPPNSELTHTLSLNDARYPSPTCSHGMNIIMNCQNSVVRLVSGGSQDNFITINYRRIFPSKNDCEFTEY